MSYICYVHRLDAGTPYMEVLGTTDLSEAETLAAELLRDRPGCQMVEIFEEDFSVAKVVHRSHG
jgi:hypothetical protein